MSAATVSDAVASWADFRVRRLVSADTLTMGLLDGRSPQSLPIRGEHTEVRS